jgi:hypothetical protein
MSRIIKRKIKRTTAEVCDENGKRLGTMEVVGQVSAPRMANIARRDKGNPLLTVRNVVTSADTYVMDVDEFVEHAERMGTIESEPEQEADNASNGARVPLLAVCDAHTGETYFEVGGKKAVSE